jgi:uncharacterized protein (DUF58 family)
MTKRTFEVEVSATVCIVVDTDYTTDFGDALDPRRMEGIYSDVDTPEAMVAHLAYNAVRNGYRVASSLDGWADLPPEAVDMILIDVDAPEFNVEEKTL